MGFWNNKSEYEEGYEKGEEARKRLEEHPIAESISIISIAENLAMDLLSSKETKAGYEDGLKGKKRK